MKNFTLEKLLIEPLYIGLYVPPIVWKGDSVGHIGENDTFFWVVEGECFLTVDSQSYIVHPGQLVYLPKGKMRSYTHVSERFSLYEMAFSAKINDKDIMETLGLTNHNFVVDVPNREEMNRLFESSHRRELYKNPLYDVAWCSNIINIIKIFAEQNKNHTENHKIFFKPVLDYMEKNIDAEIKIDDLANIVYMQPTYFIKKFKNVFGITPIAYLNRNRIFKAMGMLSATNLSIEQIAFNVGIRDISYFTRVFKKHCGVSPGEYRKEFKKDAF